MKTNVVKKTFCNPLNLDYAYRKYDEERPLCIEAADPVVVLFNDKYFLFSSVTYGYWYSDDLCEWKFIPCSENQLMTIFGYAPAIMVMDGYVYWHQGYYDKRLYRSSNPLDPNAWELVTDDCYLGHDPFMYYHHKEDKVWGAYGCGDLKEEYIKVVEIDRETLEPKGEVHNCIFADQENRGWERPYDNHTGEGWGYTEGSQIFEYNNTWYLTYSGYSLHKSYANGVFTAENPQGPYTYAQNNPCSHKNTGFIGGAGHGAFFQDKFGNWWNITCASVYISHPYERRLNLLPAGIDKDGNLYVNSTLGDYPINFPTSVRNHVELQIDWMLLSKGKKATASSTDSGLPKNPFHGSELATTEVPDTRYYHNVQMALDEDIRTFWSAASGNEGEWFCLYMESICEVYSIQLSFPIYNLVSEDIDKRYHQYKIEYSLDGENWLIFADKWENKSFVPHDYIQVMETVKARFIKVTNRHMAGDGFFALGDLRVFGKANGTAPAPVNSITVTRDRMDPRNASVTWEKSNEADGYIVKYGIASDKLYNQYQVYDASAEVRTLTKEISYYFRVDSFNSSGYTEGRCIEYIK